METNQARAFYEEHKHKIGKDFRLEVLKMSKEDVFDFMDEHGQDLIHGWRQRLHEEIIKVKNLEINIKRLEDGWVLTENKIPRVGSNVETTDDFVTFETMDYSESRKCMLAGVGGGNGYFGEGFCSDGSTGCDRGLILDKPTYWRYT